MTLPSSSSGLRTGSRLSRGPRKNSPLIAVCSTSGSKQRPPNRGPSNGPRCSPVSKRLSPRLRLESTVARPKVNRCPRAAASASRHRWLAWPQPSLVWSFILDGGALDRESGQSSVVVNEAATSPNVQQAESKAAVRANEEKKVPKSESKPTEGRRHEETVAHKPDSKATLESGHMEKVGLHVSAARLGGHVRTHRTIVRKGNSDDEILPVADASEVTIVRVEGADTHTLVVGELPLQGSLELVAPGDVILTLIRRNAKDNEAGSIRLIEGSSPMIWARLETETED